MDTATAPPDVAALPSDAKKTLSWWQAVTRFRWNSASKDEAREAERRVFSYTGVACSFKDTRVGDRPEEFMHSVSAGESGPHVVCMPGYSAASGFYYKNVSGLVQACRLHLVDWLGTGLSGRPPFTPRTREEAESWFLQSLDRWREENGVRRMVLVGHSLGGYLAANYALKYPQHVEHVVLVCPAGISEKPPDWKPPARVSNFWTLRGQVYRFAGLAWDWGWTPGALMRTLGPWSRSLTTSYTRNRMQVSEQEALDFEPYLNQCLTSPGSGEYALRHLLAPFAWARSPMEFRMDGLKVPITFIYGEQDWMDPAGAHRLCSRLREQPGRAFGGNDCEVITIPESGHFTFLDRPKTFNEALLETIQPYVTGQRQEHHSHVAKHSGPLLDETDEGTRPEALAAAFTDT